MIAAGQLRNIVVIERPDRSSSDSGEVTIAWKPIRQVYAQVKPVDSREAFVNAQTGVKASYIVIMRYNADLQPTHRLRHGRRTLHISGIVDVEGRHEELRVACYEEGDE